MCGIFAYLNNNDIALDSNVLERVYNELSMRGVHSLKYFDIERDKLDNYTSDNKLSSKFLAHSRYSTSNLAYPQPLESDYGVLIHNGVITQQDPKYWSNEEFKTENDSEILLKYLDKYGEDFQQALYDNYPLCSYAFVYYNKTNKIIFGRNAKRPLHFIFDRNNLMIASTKSIFDRSGIVGEINKCVKDSVYSLNIDKFLINLNDFYTESVDLQT